jgi:hypothetical protein
MNTEFLMKILENPQEYTADQRKIAVNLAMELLDTMEFEDPMKKQIELFGNSEQLKGR